MAERKMRATFSGGLWLALLSLAAGGAAACRTPAPEATAASPNLVLISIDTLRRDHLSVYGYGRETTPNLRRLAAEGVVFETALAAHTNTGPSHASILTGLYPQSHGATRNGEPIRPQAETLAHRLRGSGYRTAAFVSGWTLSDEATGLGSGFDLYDDDVGRRERRAPETWRKASRWLEEYSGEEPWFLFFHLFDPHYPYQPPRSFWSRLVDEPAPMRFPAVGDRGRLQDVANLSSAELAEYVLRYDGEIAFADHHLGLLLDELQRRGLYDRALIVLTSDHGETLSERAWTFDHGARAYEEQIRVPLVVRFPHAEHAGRRLHEPVHHVDILPTILAAMGQSESAACQGRSLMPLIRGAAVPDLERRPGFSLARSDPKRVPELSRRPQRRGLVTAVRSASMKLIEYPSTAKPLVQLFDLDQDPGERHDLSAQRPEVVRQLLQAARSWRRMVRPAEPRQTPEPTPEAEEALRALGYL